MKQSPSRLRSGLRLLISLFLLVLAAVIFIYRQELIDQFNYWQFKPSSSIQALATRTDLTQTGKFYFYTSRPDVEERQIFNKSCNTQRGEQTVVLGCYSIQRIHLFNVSDPQLDGIKEVTAAHEMLHAVYERLSTSEKDRIDSLLQAESRKITDASFQEVLQEYQKTEPGELNNELHSIIGTQVASISPELETYYQRYFHNRAAVVGLYQKYEAVFDTLKNQQAQLAEELDQLASSINSQSSAYNQAIVQLNQDIETFNDRAKNGQFTSETQFNSERNALAARQQRLLSTKDEINSAVQSYNTKYAQLTAINAQAATLNQSINSNLTAVPSI